ncbi:MAG: transcriptional regulator, GntR family [Rhizobacter sp.]|nr:transcriptional regulator, GntR family [Rhizobacter sp.]
MVIEGKSVVVERTNLASQIYEHLREQLMAAVFQPGQRFKIRDLAKEMGTSETPVREALIRLVRERALEAKEGYHIKVRRLSLAEYTELREIRLALEPLAAERAVPHLDAAAIKELTETHRLLIRAEKTRDYRAALQYNFDFHFGIYRRSGMPQLTEMLDRIWVQVGPMMNFLYPHGHPRYDGLHQHVNVVKALRERDVPALRAAITDDLIEGGRNFMKVLQEIEDNPARADELLALRNESLAAAATA